MNKIFIKIISAKDVLLIESPDLPACGDAFSFRAEGRELDLCGARYELSEELPSFRRAVLKIGGGVYLAECDENSRCIAAKI